MSIIRRPMNRRSLLKAGAASGLVLATPTIISRSAWAETNFRNDPTNSKTVTFGFNVPQTGAYADEGADELRAYQLAVKHLNGEGDGGMLSTMKPLSLNGNGVLGKKVDYVTGDTQTKSDAARASAKRMIEKDGVVMWSGGSSSGVAIAQQSLAQEMGVVFMCGLTHSNDTTGKDKRRYGFRHFFNAYMSGAALGPVLDKEMGKDRRAYHLTADYTWGWTQEESIANTTEGLGWETVNKVRTPLGAGDFSQYIAPVLNSGADVLILNHYGKDMINSLTQAVQFGLRDKLVNGKNFEIIVPLYSRLMAQGAGENIKGIYGTTNWNWSLQDEGSKAFVKSFGQEYGFPPSQAAHTCYVQTLLYADACERAGTFNPAEVIKALEDHQFDGMGNGPTLYRGSDHQCFKDVLVVKGNENATSQFDLLEVVEVTPASQVTYDPEIFGGELGPYKV
ncbi:Receptor family ligand binding region [Pseudovibrio sp. W64]|uniref:Amino acid/amide ABC transporter substrate-binding protein, HAAT family (TC 3.A.1.4.-) n=1 Tax=Pseudovibrio ascidiaceicola TaxID=285279 RepID=A0A1I3W588_9HYPH|nr:MULTISPECIES: substrate-binding protein [Pseudovibrio]KZK77921.1 Receptor family ligand binding region [Pseudovibrio sp. W64]KZK88777.1 Receptor family ligand binding region [Pseudovibrio sp. Ad5]KZL00270.1 Receptor family ligand binding region [Pseudovibrio sp. W74]KZL11667.1 Receptor family ligand binding region [Pseudovibrio sp. Ad14]SFK02459.1 amino acid/amide ABC transporter substrate-binding protein, HAAT family (TC 3.A.1.4.-) [Pseudovibrio ascidiaceicola]